MSRNQKKRLAALFERLDKHEWTRNLTPESYEILVGLGLKFENIVLAAVALDQLAINQPDTVRGTMYSVVSTAPWILPDTGCYDRIQRLLNILRKKGVLPFEWIVDNVRQTSKPSSWTGLVDFADTCANGYRRDFWSSLPDCVHVIVEKDAVAGRVEPVTEEYDIALHPLRGFTSTTFAWNIARKWSGIEKPIHIYYIGDHDPSGRDIERSVIKALKEYSGRQFAWSRLAVEPEHFEQFSILPLAPKKKDSRYRRFVETYGNRCAEVEAIPANDLRQMVRGAIESHIPQQQWEALKLQEQIEKSTWAQLMGQLKGVA